MDELQIVDVRDCREEDKAFVRFSIEFGKFLFFFKFYQFLEYTLGLLAVQL